MPRTRLISQGKGCSWILEGLLRVITGQLRPSRLLGFRSACPVLVVIGGYHQAILACMLDHKAFPVVTHRRVFSPAMVVVEVEAGAARRTCTTRPHTKQISTQRAPCTAARPIYPATEARPSAPIRAQPAQLEPISQGLG
jgi:hypothetical protein